MDEVDLEPSSEAADCRADRSPAEERNACQAAERTHVVHRNALGGLPAGRQPGADDRDLVSAIDKPARPAVDVDRAAVGDAEQPKAFPGHGR